MIIARSIMIKDDNIPSIKTSQLGVAIIAQANLQSNRQVF